MRRELRLRSSRRFAQIRKERRAWVNGFLVLKALPNDTAETRFGLVTSRHVGNAVVRNRVRRRLREILRIVSVKPGWDLVFIARGRSAGSDYHRLQDAAHNLLRRSRLLNPPPRGETTQC